MDGLLGGEIFRKFTVIFDLSRRRMILEKNPTFDDPIEFDMCGVTLRGSNSGELEVYRVTAGSPAAAAGIAEGDIIEAVDGRPVAAPDRDTVRDLFKGDGQKRTLTIRRVLRRFDIIITLRRMV